MKCPLISIGYLASERIDAARKCECGREKCAWWDNIEELCSVLMLTKLLSRLTAHIGIIQDKMPHEAQFRK